MSKDTLSMSGNRTGKAYEVPSNVDFYWGLTFQAMESPVDMFPVLFAARESVLTVA